MLTSVIAAIDCYKPDKPLVLFGLLPHEQKVNMSSLLYG